MSDRVERRRPKRTLTPERKALKDALWSVGCHGAGYSLSLIPTVLHPVPLMNAMDTVAQQSDEHALERQVRTLRQLYPQFLPRTRATHPDKLKQHIKNLDVDGTVGRICEAHGVDRRSAMDMVQSIQKQAVDGGAAHRCIPSLDEPAFDAARGRTNLFSRLTVFRELKSDLAALLDPRGWDNCSDLFDETFEVEEVNGMYVEKPDDPNRLGKDWNGLLYEHATVGPQAVQNILYIDFKVKRDCPVPLAKRCAAQECTHTIQTARVEYRLHESLAHEIGGFELPGLMRQNHGFISAHRSQSSDAKSTRNSGAKPRSDSTHVSCLKTVRFGRLSQWSGGGVVDYGEVFNYLAPTFLSLWIGDLQQVVPCCNLGKLQAKHANGGRP